MVKKAAIFITSIVALLFFFIIFVAGAIGGSASQSNGGKQLAQVALAEYEAGEADGTHNAGGNKYWSFMGFDGRVEWCACFVSYCANKCGFIESGVIGKTALAEGFADYVKNNPDRGTLNKNDGNYIPQIGDIFVESPGTWNVNNDNDAQHTGIVVGVNEEARTFTCVEGNSGDITRKTTYQIGHDIDYFVSPNYPAGAADLNDPLSAGETVELPTSHEHRAPDGNGGLEVGEVRGTTTTIGRPFTYTNYLSFEDKWAYTQAEVCKKWQEGGRQSQDGIATINGYYLVAMGQNYGAIGDYVRIELDNGQTINGILADSKSNCDTSPPWSNESCTYGHYYVSSNMISVIEFETTGDVSSGDLSTTKPEWENTNVKSVTNLGSIF